MVYDNIIHVHMPNDCTTTGHLPFLVKGVVRAMTGELRQRYSPLLCKTLVFVDFCGFCLCVPDVARVVKPYPEY